jgi:toxin ParE1/3/4
VQSPAASVILTERTLRDLKDIEHYSVQQWGRRTADKYLQGIEDAFARLAENPGLLRSEAEFSSGLCFYRVAKYLLACSVLGKTIYVLTVIHTSMDLPARLAELEPRLVAEAEFLHKKLRDRTSAE